MYFLRLQGGASSIRVDILHSFPFVSPIKMFFEFFFKHKTFLFFNRIVKCRMDFIKEYESETIQNFVKVL